MISTEVILVSLFIILTILILSVYVASSMHAVELHNVLHNVRVEATLCGTQLIIKNLDKNPLLVKYALTPNGEDIVINIIVQPGASEKYSLTSAYGNLTIYIYKLSKATTQPTADEIIASTTIHVKNYCGV